MMAGEKSKILWVEGIDDLHTVIHLAEKNEIKVKSKKEQKKGYDFEIKQFKGVDVGINAFTEAIKVSQDSTVGFVFDADSSLESRWQSIKDRVVKPDVLPELKMPDRIDEGGCIILGNSNKLKAQFGFWIMPDNKSPNGAIEGLLQKSIPESKLNLFQFAKDSTNTARVEKSAGIDSTKLQKAYLHTYLAWQKEPGKPYGQSIAANYFDHHSEVADRFVNWLRKLFELE